LSLNKTSEVWWNAVLKGEKEIDINQINRERSMATVDEEEHAVLDRLTFDYHQKQQGKPQSHEMVREQVNMNTFHGPLSHSECKPMSEI
ncbi:NudC domain-containing protein 3, partial [Xenoophorus captivus]